MSDNAKIPEGLNLPKMAEFWDTHSLADYWDETEPAGFDVEASLRRRLLVPVDSELVDKLQETARSRGISTESLVNLFLAEQLK